MGAYFLCKEVEGFDSHTVHLTKLIGRGNVQKDVSVGVTTR